MDLDGRIIESNPAFQAMVGYRKEELLGMPYRRLTPEKWHALDDEIIREQVLRKGYSVVYEKEDVRSDGLIFPVEIRTRLIKDQDGDPSELWVFTRDLSGRKKTEERLRESEEKFRLLFEKSVDPALLLGKDGFIDCNEAALDIMSCLEKGRLLGLSPVDISPERQPDGSLSAENAKEHARIALQEGFDRFDWVHRTFSNEELWVDVSLTAVPIRGKQIVYTVWRDITERKKAEVCLRESEERYRTAIESSNDGVAIVSDDRYVYASRKLLEIFGYDRIEDILGKPPTLVLHPDYRERVADGIRRRQEGSTNPGRYEIKGIRKDGTVIDVESSITTITYRGKLATLAYIRDVTKRKLAEEVLKKREKELEIESLKLEEANTAMKVLLRNREEDRRILENTILSNIMEMIFPYLEKLKQSHLSESQSTYLGILQSSLEDIASPLLQKAGTRYANLTPMEIQVANLTRAGKTSKEIAVILGLSKRTIDTHKNNIRKKLELSNKKVNLQAYLKTHDST